MMGKSRRVVGLGAIGLALASMVIWQQYSASWVDWRTRAWDRMSDMRTRQFPGQNFRRANLMGIVFREANLIGANFYKADARFTDFSGGATRLDGADFSEANLEGADFGFAGATGIRFRRAHLRGAIFEEAKLPGADFRGANLSGANFTRVQLQGADLTALAVPPQYLDYADLTGAKLDLNQFANTRLCQTILPDGSRSLQGCRTSFSQGLIREFNNPLWERLDWITSQFFIEGWGTADEAEAVAPSQIPTMSCEVLKALDSHWWKTSRDRFGLGLQRRLWESPEINQDYSKFADRVGWRVQGRWQKPSSQPLAAREAKTYPLGYFPWHGWQVQGPTPQDPGRFRRVGFGQWMAHLKACGI